MHRDDVFDASYIFVGLSSVQLLFIDGRVSAGIIPMMLPKFASGGLYSRFIYPVLFALLQVIVDIAYARYVAHHFTHLNAHTIRLFLF